MDNQEELEVKEVQKFTVKDFDYTEAASGKLCALQDGEGGVVGTGILRLKNQNTLVLTIDGVQYEYDQFGAPINTAAKESGYRLKMGVSNVKPTETVLSSTGSTLIRNVSDTGEVTYNETTDDGNAIIIDSLNAKDQFAIQALRGMLDKMEDPSSVSKDEITHFCEAAYLWASYMMTESSKSRSVIKDAKTSTSTSVEKVGTLDTNTDKLLNNLIVAIERTNDEATVDSSKVYSERVAIPQLMDWLNAYSKHAPTKNGDTQTTVGLDDLIKAIKEISITVNGGGSEASIDTTGIQESIESLGTTRTANIGESGLGRDADHPVYISGGGFPSKALLAAAIDSEKVHDFLTFNEAGAVGYSTLPEAKKALLGYLSTYATVSALSEVIYTNIQRSIDDRIYAWLSIVKDAEDRSLTINTPS